MERIAMSQEERDYLDWLKRVKSGRSQREAAEKMGVSERWVRESAATDEEARRRAGSAWAPRTPVESEACGRDPGKR